MSSRLAPTPCRQGMRSFLPPPDRTKCVRATKVCLGSSLHEGEIRITHLDVRHSAPTSVGKLIRPLPHTGHFRVSRAFRFGPLITRKQSLPPSAGVRSEDRKRTLGRDMSGRHANNLNGSGTVAIADRFPREQSTRRPREARRSARRSTRAERRESANECGRARRHSINEAFETLKNSLPFIPPDTKLSQIRTLHYAMNYISHLCRELGIDVVAVADVAPEATKWPCDGQVGFGGVATTPYHTAPRFRGSDQFPASYAQPWKMLYQVVHHC